MKKIVITNCKDGYKISKFSKMLKAEFGYTYNDSYKIISKILEGQNIEFETSEPERIKALLEEFRFEASVID